MVYIELSRSEIEIPWHVKVLVKITWRFSQLRSLVPSQKQPVGLGIRISWVSVSRFVQMLYLHFSIIKTGFLKILYCILCFLLPRKESVPLLWHNQMCYSSIAVALMRSTSLYRVRSFHKKSQKCCFSSIRFRFPWERWEIWPNLAKRVECTVLHSFAMENGDLIHCIALQKSLFSVTQLLPLQNL